jgi:hypothetical protein
MAAEKLNHLEVMEKRARPDHQIKPTMRTPQRSRLHVRRPQHRLPEALC